jgi:hypothetical protein
MNSYWIGRVSNRNMHLWLATSVMALLLAGGAAKSDAQSSAVERAKKAIISTFDAALPNMTLESFLNYETDGATIDWKTSDCAQEKISSGHQTRDTSKCVEAYSTLDQRRTIKIVLELPAEPALPELLSVSMIQDGLDHPLRLIQLPAATQGGHFKTRIPRDLLPLQRVS